VVVDHLLVIKKAEQIELLAADLEARCGNQMQDVLDGMPECWRGEAADAYNRKCAEMRQCITQTVEDMNEVSQAMLFAAGLRQ